MSKILTFLLVFCLSVPLLGAEEQDPPKKPPMALHYGLISASIRQAEVPCLSNCQLRGIEIGGTDEIWRDLYGVFGSSFLNGQTERYSGESSTESLTFDHFQSDFSWSLSYFPMGPFNRSRVQPFFSLGLMGSVIMNFPRNVDGVEFTDPLIQSYGTEFIAGSLVRVGVDTRVSGTWGLRIEYLIVDYTSGRQISSQAFDQGRMLFSLVRYWEPEEP